MIGYYRAIDDEDGDHPEFDQTEGDFDDEGFPVIGTCRALYPYEGTCIISSVTCFTTNYFSLKIPPLTNLFFNRPFYVNHW